MGYDSYALCNTYSVCPDDPEVSRALMAVPAVQENSPHMKIFYLLQNRWNWENLRMIRAFDGGPEEGAFTPVHVEMESRTPDLIKVRTLDAVQCSHIVKYLSMLCRLMMSLQKH